MSATPIKNLLDSLSERDATSSSDMLCSKSNINRERMSSEAFPDNYDYMYELLLQVSLEVVVNFSG